MIAAFFDLDRTVIDVNSGMLWAQHELRERNISYKQFAKAALWTALYHLSLIDMEKALGEAVRHYTGQQYDSIEQRTRQWFERDVVSRLRPKALEMIEEHRNLGHHLVLLTNSTCFEATVAAEIWGFDDWLANTFHVDDEGRLLGTYQRPMCYGKGKVTRAERWADGHDVDLSKASFYSDSFSDLPMLERVGEPMVVCPDPRLRRVARTRGWPILDW